MKTLEQRVAELERKVREPMTGREYLGYASSGSIIGIALALFIAVLIGCFAGCGGLVIESEQSCPPSGCPIECPDDQPCYVPPKVNTLLDLPPSLRTHNYAGGSCAHAGIIDVLKWHGFDAEAAYWRSNHRGAFSVSSGASYMNRKGFRYAYTTKGDADFLEWCSRNRHGAMIHYYSGHAITFRGYENGHAILQDNNRPDKRIRVKKSDFVRRWKGYGGNALTIVYSPAPPKMVP